MYSTNYISDCKFSLIIIFILGLGMQACVDVTEEVHGTLTGDQFLDNEEEMAALAGKAYTSLYQGYMEPNGLFGIQELPTDELVIPQRGQDWFAGGIWIRLKRHSYTPNDRPLNSTWEYLYGGINSCNLVLNQLQQVEEENEQKVAEVKTLRALYYYFLLDTFGNVPIVDKFDVPQDFAPANNSRKEVYSFIENEVMSSLNLLTKNVSQSTYSHVTYYAAQALLAKLYLNAEVYTGNSQWERAVDASDEIINSGKFSLMDDYFANFSVDNANLSESILAIPYDEVFATRNPIAVFTLHYASENTFQLIKTPINGISVPKEFYEMYEDEDIRKENFLVGPQYTSTGEPLIDGGVESNDPDGPQIVFTPEINELEPGALRQAGARIKKYEIATGSDPIFMDNDVHIFRYADILLTKAEALWRMDKNNPEALRLVNLIRERAGVDDYTSLTAEKLLSERGREMFAELKRRQDMIRFGTYNEEFRFHDPDGDDYVNIFPIPAEQLNTNPNLQQNPGY